MPFISRWSNNYSSTLSAAVTTTTATSITVTSATGLPSLTVPVGAVPAVTALLVGSEIMYISAISGTTLTVMRGQEGTTATTHTAGAAVTQVVTRDTLYNNSAPGAVSTTIPTGTQSYTPDLTYKYHFLTLGGSTTLTIPAPTAPQMPIQLGDEFRMHFTITGTALSAQPTWNAVYDRALNSTTQGTIVLTANARSSMSFAFAGPLVTSANAWRRIG